MNTLILKKPEILIIDNTLDYIRIIKAILEKKRYLVRSASDRKGLFNALTKRLPDLILFAFVRYSRSVDLLSR